VLISDVPWLIPPEETVRIAPGQDGTVTYTVDRRLRNDDGTIGSAIGHLVLEFLNGTGASSTGPIASGLIEPLQGPGVSASAVAVVHTVTPGSAPGTPPAIPSDEVALFIPGVAHVPGSVGVFISDLALTNLLKAGTISNLSLFFRPNASTNTFAMPPLNLIANQPLNFADIAATVFNNTTSVGSLQIRGPDVQAISAVASVFNSSNPAGTYGTVIPALRSDRSAAANQRTFLTGLRADATTHTNLYLQEAGGGNSGVRIDFFNAQGAPLGTRTEALGPFSMLQIGLAVPDGAVSASLTTTGESTGKMAAYATPVDRASGDTWAVVDWGRQYGYDSAAPMLIPVATAGPGANNTFFRTDVAIMNVGDAPGTGTMRFYSRTGSFVDRNVALPALQSQVINDIVSSLFGITSTDVGYIVFTPTSGRFALTSRTYTTVQGQAATFGSGVPTLAQSAGKRAGETIRFGGIEDSALATVQAARGGTFRTNIGLVETTGEAVVVRATLRFSSGGQRTATQGIATKEYNLAGRQYLQINGISADIIGPARQTLGDLTNLQLDLEVISGNGAIVAFASSVDNGTGDSLLRVD
jgi:hypothetical protein